MSIGWYASVVRLSVWRGRMISCRCVQLVFHQSLVVSAGACMGKKRDERRRLRHTGKMNEALGDALVMFSLTILALHQRE